MYYRFCIAAYMISMVHQSVSEQKKTTITLINKTNKSLYIACYGEQQPRPRHSIAVPKHRKSTINRPLSTATRWFIVGAFTLNGLPPQHSSKTAHSIQVTDSLQTVIFDVVNSKMVIQGE